MSLRYVLGKSATGKTTLCVNEIVNTDNMAKRIFYIVPEQFTLESEKNLLNKKDSLININVLGFRHFAYYLISKMGTSGRKILDDAGRAMLIKKIVLELRNKLDFYKNSVDKQGFVDNLDETITELMQYSISDENLSQLILRLKEGNLKEKLKDIQLIFNKYREYLNNSYIASDGILDILYELIPDSCVKDSEVWIDGFKSFTPQENKVIGQLLKYCNRVNITLPLNSASVEYKNVSAFDENYEVKRAITAITSMAKENNINIKTVTFLNKDYRTYNEEMEHLKENYFKYKFKTYEKEVNNISVYRSANMYDEIEHICGAIKSLVQYKNYRYRDIALITGDSSYNVPLSIALKKYDIPNFLDGRKSVASHPVITLITSAVDIVAYGFDNSAVFKFLKTGYTDISFDEIFILENYTLANGINKYKWEKEWKYGFKDERYGERPEREVIEDIRNRFFEIISPLKNSFTSGRKTTVKEITEGLFKLLNNINVKKRLEKELNRAKLKGDNVKAVIDEGVWAVVIDVVNKMIDILGDERVTLREYSKILKTGLNTATIGVVPPTQDYLIVGNMEITRFPDIKAMFIIGANEGNIPVRLAEKGIFTDDEKQAMEDNNVELAPSVMQKMNNGRLSIYLNIIKAEDYLVFSYPTGSIRGGALSKSSIISRIEALFPTLKEKTVDNSLFEVNNVLAGREAAFGSLIRAVSENNNSEFVNELYKYFSNDKEYAKKLKSIKYGIISQLPKNYISEKLMDVLWQEVYGKGSVSKLEKFTACPFAFYMNYVLNAEERNVFQLKNTEIGTLSHKIMEEFSKHIKSENIDWSHADRNYTDSFIDEHISEFVSELNSDIFESNRNSAILDKIVKSAKLSLWANVEQIKAGRFKPESFEISFGRNNSEIPAIEIEVEHNKILKLNGIIDRVDKMLAEDGRVYVKIVDYKSSSKSLDINKIYNGLQLQLVLYMNTIIADKNTEAGGMFYFKVSEPDLINEGDSRSGLSYEDFILNRMALNGMYNENVTEDLDSAKIEVLVRRKPVEILRDISASDSTVLGKEQMNNLLEYSKDIVKNIGKEMAKGNIEISPYQYGNESSCKFCPYGMVCDFKNSKGENMRNIEKRDGEIWEIINNKVNK